MNTKLPPPNTGDVEQAKRDLASPFALEVVAQLRAELRHLQGLLHPTPSTPSDPRE